MSITRKNLREKLGAEVSDETISDLLNLIHTEVDSIRDERDEIQQKLNAATTEAETAKTAKEKAEKDFEDYKIAQTAKETRSAKEAAYKELLKEAGIGDKRFGSILKVTDFDNLELDKDGRIKGAKECVEQIKTDYADFIVASGVQGADVAKPPVTNTGKTAFEAMSLSEKMNFANAHPAEYAEYTKG